MELLRIGVSTKPHPILSVEFLRGRKLYVWRLKFNPFTYTASDIVARMKRDYKRYLDEVSSDQLITLVKHVVQNRGSEPQMRSGEDDLNKLDDFNLNTIKSSMEKGFRKNEICKADGNFIYDLQVDFPTPRGLPFDSDCDGNT